MKYDLKISTLSIVSVLCAAMTMPAFAASSVRSLGGVGTYSSASSAANAKSGSGDATTSMRSGSMRVNSSGDKGAAATAGRVGSSRAATTPRLSIGKYLAGSSAISGGSSNKVESGVASGSSVKSLSKRVDKLEDLVGGIDVKQLKDDIAELTGREEVSVDYQNGVLTIKQGEDVVVSEEFATVEGMEEAVNDAIAKIKIPTLLSELENDVGFITAKDIPEIPSFEGFVDEQDLQAVKDALQAAIDEKQDAGSYAEKSVLESLAAKVAQLEQGAGTSSDVAELQARVEEIALDYASKDELSDAEKRLQAAIAAIDLSSYAKVADVNAALALKADVADLATVATSGSYNDLIDVPTDLVKQSALGALEASLQSAIKAGDDAAAEELAALKKQVEGMSAGGDVAGLEARIAAIENAPYASEAYVDTAVQGVKGLLSDYAKAADVEAELAKKANQDVVDAITASLSGLEQDVATNLEYITSNSEAIKEVNDKFDGLATVAKTGKFGDLVDAPDMNLYVTNTTLEQNYVTNETIQNNYVTNQALEEKKYLTEDVAKNTYVTDEEAANTFVTQENVNSFVKIEPGSITAVELADGSVTVNKLASGSVSADKIDTGTGNAGEMVMLMSNGDGTSEWVSVGVAEDYE